MLTLAGLLFGNDIIRIVTNHGELIIESDDPNIKVEVLQNGDLVQVIDTSTQQHVDIIAGNYSITASGSESQYSITPNKLTLTRGDKRVVTITKVPSDSNDTIASNTPTKPLSDSSTGSDRVFNGRTFDEWLHILDTETNAELLGEAIHGGLVLWLRAMKRDLSRHSNESVN
ncbi:MAG: hypothetical protein R3C03_08800 [Pirellulaceae bacterium]